MTILLTEHRPPPAVAAAPTDADLAARAARGEPGAFAELYQRHVEAVYHYLRFRVRDAAVAEDLTHDVFVAALRAVRTLQSPERVAAWFLRIAHNRLANHWRSCDHAARHEAGSLDADPADGAGGGADDSRARSLSGAAAGGADDAGDPSVLADALADVQRVQSALTRLTPLQRDVLGLRFVAGLTFVETAAALDRTVASVKNVQHEALVKLRRELAAPVPGPGVPR